ncbi:MAG: hypothetical protein JWQ87_2659 [Candidatus Sulfotelmatobacter sp.]|nr:hypothetical protein [Candidatus Sulfotelmatobacter sp.]
MKTTAQKIDTVFSPKAKGNAKITLPLADMWMLVDWALAGLSGVVYKMHLSNGGNREPEVLVHGYAERLGLRPPRNGPPQAKPIAAKEPLSETAKLASQPSEWGKRYGPKTEVLPIDGREN